MNNEETLVVDYLRSSPESFMARREIARKAVKRRDYEENPHWIDAPLAALLAQKVIEQDDSGHFRLAH